MLDYHDLKLKYRKSSINPPSQINPPFFRGKKLKKPPPFLHIIIHWKMISHDCQESIATAF